MTTNNITQSTELLTQFRLWAELEPDRCRVDTYNDTPRLKAQSDIALKLGAGWTTVWSTIGDISANGLAIVQAVVQEAIAARGWHWSLCMNDADEYDCEAEVINPDAPDPTPDPNGGTGEAWIREDGQPAIALLSAYLAALQAARAAA